MIFVYLFLLAFDIWYHLFVRQDLFRHLMTFVCNVLMLWTFVCCLFGGLYPLRFFITFVCLHLLTLGIWCHLFVRQNLCRHSMTFVCNVLIIWTFVCCLFGCLYPFRFLITFVYLHLLTFDIWWHLFVRQNLLLSIPNGHPNP